jgi:ribulose kinase
MNAAIGIDYGTNSVRAIVAEVSHGNILGSCVFNYPSGHQGVILDDNDPHLARQNPQDHITGLETSVRQALAEAAKNHGLRAENVVGIGVDTTGSSPIPVDSQNTPLALHEKWKKNPNAHCWLWKDHTSIQEAARITATAAQHRPHYIAKCGNTYSSEWFWAKIWHCLNTDPEVFHAAYSWVELSDFIPALLCGIKNPTQIRRNICAGGIAEKNPLLMQIYADITGCEMLVADSPQACALSAAISGAVCAEVYADFPSAQQAMTSLKDVVYKPIAENRAIYDQLNKLYMQLHDAFGGVSKEANRAM